MIKAVIDTNVFVSGLLKKEGTPREIYLKFKEGKFKLVFSDLMFDEIMKVTARNKFHNLIDSHERKELAYFIQVKGEFITPSRSISICRDSADNHFIALALESKSLLVTGDKDILDLRPSLKEVSILAPSYFLHNE